MSKVTYNTESIDFWRKIPQALRELVFIYDKWYARGVISGDEPGCDNLYVMAPVHQFFTEYSVKFVLKSNADLNMTSVPTIEIPSDIVEALLNEQKSGAKK